MGIYGTGTSSSHPSHVQFHTRTRTLATRTANATRPGEGRMPRVPKARKEERLEDGLNRSSSSAVCSSKVQARPLSKKRAKRKSAFLKRKKASPQLSKSSSSHQVKGDDVLSTQTPSTINPMSEPTPIPEYDPDDEEVEVFRQLPNPPFPKYPFVRHPSGKGINGKAAAIAYLRIRGLANCGRKKTFFTILAWVLRHAARDLGFEIVPDGFVRISDLVGLLSLILVLSNREGS
jgi:hypothetical protein